MERIKDVSVVMCTFNGEKYIREQIDSILSQTYPIYEIIIQDDCSSDNTWYILQEYVHKYSIIKCYQNNKNIGSSLNFITALFRSKGEYTALSDQDDIWMPHKIDILINTIKDKMLAIGQSNIVYTDTNCEMKSFDQFNPYNTNIEKLIWCNTLLGHSCLINKSLIDIIKCLDFEFKIAHDHLIAFIAYYYNSVAITDEITQIWRRHNEAATIHSLLISKGKIYKFFTASYCFITKNKSLLIEETFNEFHSIFLFLSKDKTYQYPNIKEIINLTKYASEQTFFSYIKASLICLKLKNKMFDHSKKNKKKVISILLFLYVWWYDYRFDRW